MRSILLSTLFLIFHLASSAQEISYQVPDYYKNKVSKEDYKRIVDIASYVVEKKYKINYIKDGIIQLNIGQVATSLKLDDIVLHCIEIQDKSTWGKEIQNYFQGVFNDVDAKQTINPNDFESIRQNLSVRIYPAQAFEGNNASSRFVMKTDLPDTYSLLMLDMPNSFTPVEKKVFDSWSKSTSEVFKIALANVSKQPMEKLTEIVPFDGAKIEVGFIENKDYAASYMLDLASNSPEMVGEWGSVVAIPNKAIANICKISRSKPLDFMKFIQLMNPVLKKYYSQHPQPVSNQFFWYYKGAFTKIIVLEDGKGNISVITPLALSELLASKK